MADKFRNTYRIASARAPFWNYGWNAAYFVTLCTRNRNCFFGSVTAGKMVLSDMGRIAQHCWLEIPRHFPFVELDQFVIMPDHVHGILIINKPGDGAGVPATHIDGPGNQFGPQSKNLASIIRGFKIGVTKEARKLDPDFAWQARYHDRIIRDGRSFENISRYISENPSKWVDDKFGLR